MIVVLISRFKVHASLSLLAASFFVGFAAGTNPVDVTKAIMKGFGDTAERIGIVIIAGTIIGYITSILVFYDSGFVVLSALNKSLSAGLYATHTLVPPTPGPIAAANNLHADLGMVIFIGLIVTIHVTLAGYLWVTKFASQYEVIAETSVSCDELLKRSETVIPAKAGMTSNR